MKYTSAIITVSDSCFSGERKDMSKNAIEEILNQNDFEIISYTVVPDENEKITEILYSLCKRDINLIITTGGTGFSIRDITPEATRKVIKKEACGIMEAMRLNSMQITKKAMLSRGVCGIRNKSVILNLPGSPDACRENLSFVINELKHGIDTLLGNAKNCGDKNA